MNQVNQLHIFVCCMLSAITSTSWVFGEDWKITFDHLSSHEASYRVVVNADGTIAAFTKQRRSKEFEMTSKSTITSDTVQDLRRQVIKLQQMLQTITLTKKSSRDIDVKYRLVYEHDGVEIETKWLAGQVGSNHPISEAHLSILELLQKTSGMDTKLKPDSFLKPTRHLQT